MSYSIDIDPGAQEAIAALPVEALLALAEAFAVLETEPSSAGRSVNPERNPDSGVRNLPFAAAGMITYLVVEHALRVDILLITWVGMRTAAERALDTHHEVNLRFPAGRGLRKTAMVLAGVLR